MDAYKSQHSLIVVDDIEDLIDYVDIGPRFSTTLLQTFRNFFRKSPPSGRRLVIMATTRNKRLMDQLGLSQSFHTQLHAPNINSLDDFRTVLLRNQNLTDEEQQSILEEVKRVTARGSAFSIPVKILVDLLEIAAQDPEDRVLRFMDEFQHFIVKSSYDQEEALIVNMQGL